MANVDLITGFRTTFFQSFSGADSSLEQASDKSFTLRADNGRLSQEFTGSFEINKKGGIKSGQIRSFSVLIDDQIAWTLSDLNLNVKSYNSLFTTGKQEAFDGLFGGADIFSGGEESDHLFSYAGNDKIDGKGGNDILDAGIGDDTLIGGAGNDMVVGNGGEDILVGGEGFDEIAGGVDADLLTGGPGDDVFQTRDGESPELTGTFSFNSVLTLIAGNGIDIITDFSVFDRISAGNGTVPAPFEPLGTSNINPGDPRVLRGTWQEDTLASGLNRGRFRLDDEGEDLFFFVVTDELSEFLQSRQIYDVVDPSIFGSQLFVLLEQSGIGLT